MNSKKTTLLLIRILEKIVFDKKLHARWLNTLSFLEYIGARKMLKSLPAEHINNILLTHINEESRHSLFFKKLSKKVLGEDLFFKQEEMFCSQQAETYFQNVDKKAQTIADGENLLNYLYTTYMVETRAVSAYTIYNKILERNNFSFTLQALLKEEENHLDNTTSMIKELDPLWEQHLEQLKQAEYSLYFSLLHDLEEELTQKQVSKSSSLFVNTTSNTTQ